jgi:hypothetical protein
MKDYIDEHYLDAWKLGLAQLQPILYEAWEAILFEDFVNEVHKLRGKMGRIYEAGGHHING